MARKILSYQHLFLSMAFLGMLSCSTTYSPPSPPDFVPTRIQEREPLPFPHSLGVLPFDYHGESPRLAWLRLGLPDMLITDLALWPGVNIVSRQLLGEVLREQWLQHRGMTEPGSAVRLGQLSGVRYLLKGSYFVVGSQLTVDVHVLDVEHGIVVRTGRITEALEKFPALERQLAKQIGGFFGIRSERVPQEKKNNGPHIMEPQPQHDIGVPKTSTIPPASDDFSVSQSPILPVDTLLRLDRAQRIREEGWYIADEAWRHGFAIELDSPNFGGTVPESAGSQEQDVVWIPVSSFFVADRLRNLHRDVHFSLLDTSGTDLTRGTIFWKGDQAMASQLFTERFRSPRRLFVRAISQSGAVLGVASEWSWRVDHFLESKENGGIEVSVWPTRTIVGEAGFSTKILALHQNIHHFDAMVVSVPGERRMVSVESMKPVGKEHTPTSEIGGQEHQIRNHLEKWFFENWRPRVTESLPVHGYLPGNRRTVQLRISGHNGTVHDARMSHKPNEVMFVVDVSHLFAQLIGHCFFSCQEEPNRSSEQDDVFHMRVQLDLIKDLRHVGLGQVVK